MNVIALDRQDRCVSVEIATRQGRVIYRKGKEYAMRGVSWAWGKPAYPRRYFLLQFLPIFGPFIANYFFIHSTMAIVADGVPATMEPQEDRLVQSVTDEQALAIMEAHQESMSIGKQGLSPLAIVAILACVVAVFAILAAIVR